MVFCIGFLALYPISFWFAKLSAQISNKVSGALVLFGKYSLEIYVLHWFFLPRMHDWGKYLLGQASFNENLILTAMVCSIVSVFMIAFCMIVAKIVKQSSILDYLCFGVKKKNN